MSAPMRRWRLQANREDLEHLVSSLFPYADEGTFASLRLFDQFRRDVPPLAILSVKLNGSQTRLIDAALKIAQRGADNEKSTVFAPPIATFRTANGAKGVDLANGLVLSAELDDAPGAARMQLEGLLGPATLVVASGSDWIDPATGEVQSKLHLHWRLSEPTRTEDEHTQLRIARTAASLLVGADPTGKPVVHPYRWPGSWNTKATPRLCRIVARNDGAEIHLVEAMEILAQSVEASGLAISATMPVSGNPQAPMARIRSAMAAVPNPGIDVHYSEWINFGYAVFNATGGEPDAFDIWDAWSRKSDKYNAGETEAAWKRIVAAINGTNAPRKIGAGTIIMKAKTAGWIDPNAANHPPPPEPRQDAETTRTRWDHYATSPPTSIGAGTIFHRAKAAGWTDPAQGNRPPPPESPDDYGTTTSKPRPNNNDAAQPESPSDAAIDDPVSALVAEFNRKYWVINESGKAIIYAPNFDPILNRRYHHRMGFSDLGKLYMNRRVKIGQGKNGEPILADAATVWLRHRDRKQFIGGVTFDPGGNHQDPEILNLWQGFAVNPARGRWNLMQDHILTVICASDREHYDYLIAWMARLIQFPAQQGEVSVVLKGIEGTGKGLFARALLTILGQHGLTISHAKHLTGNFNAHLRDCVFLFADEAFYAGDKAHVGVLKALITEPTLTVEAKYQNAVQAPNFVHLMMASNETWVVPASLEARRFLVLLTAATKVGNRPYFSAIQKQMEQGGYEAMLHDLLHHNLADFNVRDVPDTEGLQEQKKLSLGTSEAWWLDVLHRGYVYRSKLGLEEHFGQWHDTVTTEVLYSSYSEFAKARNERHPMAREWFGRFMIDMGAKYTQPRKAVMGEHLTDSVNAYGVTSRKAALIEKDRATGYDLGNLKAARNAFIKATNLPTKWEAADDVG